MYSFYGTISEANEYFMHRLHESAWSDSSPDDRRKALIRATALIDRLNFKGEKAAVYALMHADGTERRPTPAERREAEVSQELEFPRGTDTEVPQEIKIACWELSHALLDGIDPDLEIDNLGVVSQGIVSVRTTYSREQTQNEHILHGIVSASAWRYLRPFLRDGGIIKLSRVD